MEPTKYEWAEPGAPERIEGFSNFEVLAVALERDCDDMVEATLVKSGLLASFDENITVSLTFANVRARMYVRRVLLNCQSRQWMNGIITDCIWDDEAGMTTYHLAVALDEPTTITQCSARMWVTLHLPYFVLRPLKHFLFYQVL
jgi:hypothetical protein